MGRDGLGYVKLQRSQWTDTDFNGLPFAAQWLYNRLVSHPRMSRNGVTVVSASMIARLAPDMTVDVVDAMLDMLEAGRYILRDFETDEVMIRSYIRHDCPVRNPKMVAGVESSLRYIQSRRLAAAAELELRRAVEELTHSDHHAELVDNQETPARSRSDRDAIPNHPIIHHPSSNNQSSNHPAPPVDNQPADSDRVRQAIDAYAEWRTTTKKPTNPESYRTTVIRNTKKDHGPTIDAYITGNPDATPYDICTHILDMPQAQALKYLTTAKARR
jgi:hypothetical protein